MIERNLEMNRKNEAGFSLVELAIVLIIIGLIVGGVLKGQELIESARVNSIQTQLNEIRTASGTFQNKYDDLPGDIQSTDAQRIPGSVAPHASGDGNGQVDGATRLAATANESTWFWQHLRVAGLLGGVSANATVGAMAAADALRSRVGGLYTIDFETQNSTTGHWIQLGDVAAAADTNNNQPVLTPVQLRGIDVKSDDGDPDSGLVGGQGANCVAAGDYATGANANVENCFALFRL